MSADSNLADASVDPDDELLVAYLDGELEIGPRNDLEDRLLNDEALRLRLQTLQSSWDMLDDLPSPDCNEKLVESTLELVVADVTRLIPSTNVKKSFVRRYGNLLVGFALAILIPVVSYVCVGLYRKTQLQQQLADLELAENVDAYAMGNDLELIRELTWNESFNQMIQNAEAFGVFRGDVSTVVRDTPLSDRETMIASLPVEQRATIETRWNQFRVADLESKEEIRKTAETVKAQTNADMLLKTMAGYAAWRQSLPGNLRDGIADSKGDARREAIADAIDFTMGEISRDSGKMISDETAERIVFALKKIVEDRVANNSELAAQLQPAKLDERSRMFVIGALLRGSRLVTRITFEELEQVAEFMDDDAKETLNLLANFSPFTGRDAHLQELTMRTWAEEALLRTSFGKREKPSLIKRYEEIPDEQRDSLDLKSPEKFKKSLSEPNRFWRPPGFGGSRSGPPRRGNGDKGNDKRSGDQS